MRIEFPLTLAAVQQGEKSQWKIGDALGQEIDPGKPGVRDTSWKRFTACAEMLSSQGYSYSMQTLVHLRDVAAAFPAPRRRMGVAVSAHSAAATPDNLDQAIEALEKARKPINQDNVRMVMRAWREKDKEERAKQKEAASTRKKAASTRKRNAATKAERDAAEREEREAAEQEANLAAAPKTKDVGSAPPNKSELEVQATCMKIEADAARIVKTLRDNLDELDNVIDRVDADFANGLIAHQTKIIFAAQKIVDRLAKTKRFKVHQGGAA
jgi:hypothetical protein